VLFRVRVGYHLHTSAGGLAEGLLDDFSASCLTYSPYRIGREMIDDNVDFAVEANIDILIANQ